MNQKRKHGRKKGWQTIYVIKMSWEYLKNAPKKRAYAGRGERRLIFTTIHNYIKQKVGA